MIVVVKGLKRKYSDCCGLSFTAWILFCRSPSSQTVRSGSTESQFAPMAENSIDIYWRGGNAHGSQQTDLRPFHRTFSPYGDKGTGGSVSRHILGAPSPRSLGSFRWATRSRGGGLQETAFLERSKLITLSFCVQAAICKEDPTTCYPCVSCTFPDVICLPNDCWCGLGSTQDPRGSLIPILGQAVVSGWLAIFFEPASFWIALLCPQIST